MVYVVTLFLSGKYVSLLLLCCQALDDLDLPPRIQRKCVKSLYNTCARYSLLPGSLQIAVSYNPAIVPHSHGGFANVWKGEYSGLEVAVKVLKTSIDSDLEKITRVRFQRGSRFHRAC